MFSQYFGQYLLNKSLLTAEQLSEAISYERTASPKLGVLAIDAGFMTAAQVEKVHFLQHSLDKKFGEIAVDKGYMSVGQLDDLLRSQKSKRLNLSQVIVDKGYLSLMQLESVLAKYNEDNKLTQVQINALEDNDFDKIARMYLNFSTAGAEADLLYAYAALAMRCFLRILGEKPVIDATVPQRRLITQSMAGECKLFTGMTMDDSCLLQIARRYSGEDLATVDELSIDCVAEFLNEINGLFTVNMSDMGIEFNLQPPNMPENKMPADNSYHFSIVTSCGAVGLHLALGS